MVIPDGQNQLSILGKMNEWLNEVMQILGILQIFDIYVNTYI